MNRIGELCLVYAVVVSLLLTAILASGDVSILTAGEDFHGSKLAFLMLCFAVGGNAIGIVTTALCWRNYRAILAATTLVVLSAILLVKILLGYSLP
jgi:hypothetical protein